MATFWERLREWAPRIIGRHPEVQAKPVPEAVAASGYRLTGAQMSAICPSLSNVRAVTLAALHNEVCPAYKINTPARLAMFIAQEAHESDEFRRMVENLNYSVSGLKQTFSYYRARPTLAAQHGRSDNRAAKQEMIANTVYADANRQKGYKLGNTQPGDGWAFRGSAWTQLTGRELLTKYARYKKMDVRQVAELIRTDERWATDASAWLFAVEKALLDESDRGDIVTVSKRINGTTLGLDDRKKYFERAKRVIR